MLGVYPEDEFGLFNPPVVNTIQLPAQPISLGKPDTLRISMLFSGYGMGGNDFFRISPAGSAALQGCIVIVQQSPFVSLTWLDHGPFVQCGWQVDGSGLGFLTLTAVSLNGNPEMRGYTDLFKRATGLGIHDHAALHRAAKRAQSRPAVRRAPTYGDGYFRRLAPQLFPSEG
jgi:hypothetical protein